MSELRSKLEEDLLAAAPWDALREHLQNIVVVRRISLVDAGEALAEDDVIRVEGWLADGTLSKPSQDQLDEWQSDEPSFVALIVQPWILIQAED